MSGYYEVNAPSTSEIPFDSMSMEITYEKVISQVLSKMSNSYMNGTMYVGHSFAFTASKIEFAIGFIRKQGKRISFPPWFLFRWKCQSRLLRTNRLAEITLWETLQTIWRRRRRGGGGGDQLWNCKEVRRTSSYLHKIRGEDVTKFVSQIEQSDCGKTVKMI